MGQGAAGRMDTGARADIGAVAAGLVGRHTVWVLLVFLVAVGGIFAPAFLSPANIFNVLRQATALGFVSIGQTFAIAADCIDLSVGAVISLTSCLAAGIMDGQAGGILPALGVVAVSVTGVGLINGLAVGYRKGNPFIVTLGSMAVVNGAVLLYTQEQHVGSAPPGFRIIAEGALGPVPLPVLLALVAFVAAHFVLRHTQYGRYVLAVGGNEEVARLSGIATLRIKILTYLVAAGGAGITGLFLTARMNVGDPLVGVGFELDAISAVVIGGTDIMGGRGSIAGTLGGVLLYAVLSNVMNLLNILPFSQIVVKGVIIILAISTYHLRRAR
jgi:ribose/xylose/arabinose/galactoside ABC-type transport system permease subunit